MKTIYLSFAFIAILFSNDLKAAYEDDFQARADSLYERVASMSESDFSWAPEHVMAKIIAHYELGETATADDLIEFGSGGTTYPEKEPFHFTYYSSVRVLYLYPNATGVRNSKQTYVQSVWDRQDSYNIWTGEGTENHVNMCRPSGYLYGLLARDTFPGQFSNPDPSAMVDSMVKWIEYKSKRILEVGTGEWNSSQYGVFNIIPWINLYDFAKDPDIKSMAKAVCDYYACELALHYSWGITGGAETRRSGGWESTSTQTAYLCWLWFGDTPRPKGASFWSSNKAGTQATYAASSTYRPPEIARQLARKELTVPAYYHNSKPSYWLDDQSLSKQNFYIDKSYTLGAGYLPFGGWSGADFAYVTWKLVSEAPASNSAEWVTGNGMYCTYKQTNGGKVDPFTQVAQHKNVVIQLTKVPDATTKSDIESTIDGIFAQWKTDWQTDFDSRFPSDVAKSNPVDDGVSGYRNSDNECYVKYSGTAASTTTQSNIFFIELESTYIAVRSVAQSSPSSPVADGSDYFVTDNAALGTICGLVVEAGCESDYTSFSDFQTAVVNNTSLTVNSGSDNVVYTTLSGETIDMTYQEDGTFRTTLFDWGYGADHLNGYVIQSSPPFIQPTWPTGKGYGRLASWSIDGTPYSLSGATAVYDGPNLLVENGVLLLKDGSSNCYQVDYRGDVPTEKNSCTITDVEEVEKKAAIKKDNETSGFDIYPNPSDGLFYLSGVEDGATASVSSIKGNTLLSLVVKSGTIDLSTLPAGVYIVVIGNEAEEVVVR